MNISIKCFATLHRHTPENCDEFPITENETLASLAERLGIPEKEIKITFINGVSKKLDAEVKPGDRVGFFPAVGGG